MNWWSTWNTDILEVAQHHVVFMGTCWRFCQSRGVILATLRNFTWRVCVFDVIFLTRLESNQFCFGTPRVSVACCSFSSILHSRFQRLVWGICELWFGFARCFFHLIVVGLNSRVINWFHVSFVNLRCCWSSLCLFGWRLRLSFTRCCLFVRQEEGYGSWSNIVSHDSI